MKRAGFVIGVCMGVLVLASCGSKVESGDANTEVASDAADNKETEMNIEDDETETIIDDGKEEASGENSEENNIDAEKEIPILRDCFEEKFGERIGCATTLQEIKDEKVFDIITTHFNAVTLGNELKPDSLFGYSNGSCPGTIMEDLNGEILTVPVMDYSRPEKMLDMIYDWNAEHPDKKIMVRGHVLLWHSQTPEWFFHEDYDKKKPYVDKDTMNKRLEWYIKTVLTHFTGEDSKYKDMFYGWDVVNEAISDATGTYRTDNENPSEELSQDTHGSNSSWWHVYGSSEFIINAFKYANKYAPESLELYYNDYNECSIQKRKGIIALLEEIKANEGEPGTGTRITAFGMQGHYDMENPNFNDVEVSIKEYAKVVGSVQITELDLRASSSYDGSEESKIEEYEKQRKRYNMLYFAIKSAAKEEFVNVSGITFWGTVDQYSWLQSRSNVGGGNTTGLPCVPLLFGDDYQPKPCFYVFTE